MITSERIEDAVRVIEIAAKKAAQASITDLTKRGVLREENFQRIIAQGDKVVSAVTLTVTTLLAELAENIVGRLKLISGAKKIILKPTTGDRIIGTAKTTFRSYIDPDFKGWGLNVKSTPTKETAVQVYEQIKDGTFAQIYGGFGENLDRLCLTQDQIIDFCENNSDWLSDNFWPRFLFKVGEEFFVARVRVSPGGLRVGVRRFLDRLRLGCRGPLSLRASATDHLILVDTWVSMTLCIFDSLTLCALLQNPGECAR